jgi:hypothetical protein
MNIHDTEPCGGHEIDPNLVEIADMLRIQEELHEVSDHAENRVRDLARRQIAHRGKPPGKPR